MFLDFFCLLLFCQAELVSASHHQHHSNSTYVTSEILPWKIN